MSVSHSKYIHYGQSIFTWRTKMPRKFRRRWQSHVPRNKWPALRILFEKWNRLEFFYALKFLARTFYTIYMLIMILTISHTPCTNVIITDINWQRVHTKYFCHWASNPREWIHFNVKCRWRQLVSFYVSLYFQAQVSLSMHRTVNTNCTTIPLKWPLSNWNFQSLF